MVERLGAFSCKFVAMKAGLTSAVMFLVILGFLVPLSEVLGSELPVPFIFDDNRVFAELDFVRPDGTLRKAFAFVDLGTPAMVLDSKLHKELQIDRGKPLLLRVG